MAGIAIAGSCLFHAYASNKYCGLQPRLSVSIPAQFHKEFPPPLPAFISLNQSLQTSLIRCFNTNKAASAESEESEKPNKGYFSRDTIDDAAARIAPAVAILYAKKGGREEEGEMGSGTVIHEDGYILTCSHLFFDKTDVTYAAYGKVTVHTQDVERGHVVDAYVDLDIAIVKIDTPSSALSTAQVGSSSKLRPGDWAIAIGCPLSLQHAVTLGIISCVNRKSNELKRGGMAMEYLQTDCAINPGNSGGPLCNIDGELVGVNVETMKLDKASGVSFAVPVDFISAIIKPFLSCQIPAQPHFGWVMRNASKKNFKTLKQHYPTFPNAAVEGVFVQKVIKGSPADRAGVQAGDVIVDFNGEKVRHMNEMLEVMGTKSGATVNVIVRRVEFGEDRKVPLTITFEQRDVATPRP
ncbi:hypothetical protein ACJRO7_032965 [Eucalyptus globulus]|uniref:PDZ domain-containing protein n=1 Tax=Eucalyptus globulus TaxID=34317 RepID=A0ABD3JJP4_EUCGL